MTRTLSDLKVGDEVVVLGSFGSRNVRRIDRLTPKQIVVGETRYRKDDGHEIGGDVWKGSRLSLEQQDFLKAHRSKIEITLKNGARLSRTGIDQMRAAADQAEAYLREVGEWE